MGILPCSASTDLNAYPLAKRGVLCLFGIVFMCATQITHGHSQLAHDLSWARSSCLVRGGSHRKIRVSSLPHDSIGFGPA